MIGEGERDEAPMLYIGEEVGAGGPEVDIALDPLEGTTITAKGGQNALAVMAMTDKQGFANFRTAPKSMRGSCFAKTIEGPLRPRSRRSIRSTDCLLRAQSSRFDQSHMSM